MYKRSLAALLVIFSLASAYSNSSSKPTHQNGLVMTPQLVHLQAKLKSELDTLIKTDAHAYIQNIALSDGIVLENAEELLAYLYSGKSSFDDISITDNKTNYAYSVLRGLYLTDPYVLGSDGVYRNSEGETRDVPIFGR